MRYDSTSNPTTTVVQWRLAVHTPVFTTMIQQKVLKLLSCKGSSILTEAPRYLGTLHLQVGGGGGGGGGVVTYMIPC